jgi:hypothetical protein
MKIWLLIALAILCAFSLVACDALNPPTPTPNIASPTVQINAFPTTAPTVEINTPAPSALATPIRLPTGASTPAIAVPTPSAVSNALKKTQDVQTYRVTLQVNVKSASMPFALNLTGEVVGKDSHYAYKLGNDQIELTTLRGQYFIKGPRLNLPTTTKWYIVSPDLADAARPPFAPDDVLDNFIGEAGSAVYQAAAREQLDGQNCQVWRATPKMLNDTGIGNLLGGGAETSSFGAIDQAEVKLWACDDGIVHQLNIQLDAHNTKRASDKGSAQFILRLQNIGDAAIKITAPANAEPFQIRAP